MLSRESLEKKIRTPPFSPRLIPKAYAFVPETQHSEPFVSYARERVPISAFEPITGSVRAACERELDYIGVCSEAGMNHLRALETAVHGAASLAILTIGGEPIGTLKRTGYGMPNILSFRHQMIESDDGIVHPLVPGGIYVSGARVIQDAWRGDAQPVVAIDGEALYPAGMFFECEHPRTARRKYARAESLFERISGA